MANREIGTVIECNEQTAVIALVPKTCDGCSCGIKDKKPILIKTTPISGLTKGDNVWVQTETNDLLKAGFILGIVPTSGFFAGIAGVALLVHNPPQYMYFIGGSIGVATVFMIMKLFSIGKNSQPTIIAIKKDGK